MTEDELFAIMCGHFSSLFPRSCGSCGRRYESLKQYILETERVAGTTSYDAQMGDWTPDDPMGGFALAQCACGNTMALSTDGIPLAQVHGILAWLHAECERRGVSPKVALEELRDRVRAWAVAGGPRPAAEGPS